MVVTSMVGDCLGSLSTGELPSMRCHQRGSDGRRGGVLCALPPPPNAFPFTAKTANGKWKIEGGGRGKSGELEVRRLRSSGGTPNIQTLDMTMMMKFVMMMTVPMTLQVSSS